MIQRPRAPQAHLASTYRWATPLKHAVVSEGAVCGLTIAGTIEVRGTDTAVLVLWLLAHVAVPLLTLALALAPPAVVAV